MDFADMTYNVDDWDQGLSRRDYDQLMPWLQAHGPDEWHGCAASWNYDSGDATMAWICMQPDCDMATAQDVYWKCNGDAHFETDRILTTDDPGVFDPGFKLARFIAQRWSAGGYTRAKIRRQKRDFAFIESMYSGYQKDLRNYNSWYLPWRAPRPVQPINGYQIDENFFVEGIPVILGLYPSYDEAQQREWYLRALSYVQRNVDQGRMEKPAYWFGEKFGWIKASDIPDYRTMGR